MTVRTRFAPSPTGFLHVGGARTALFNFLFARHHGGQFLLRIEDTDLERSTPESVQAILDGMQWLGLESDESVVYQRRNLERHRAVVEQLLTDGHAYRCNCSRERLEQVKDAQRASGQTARYDGHCRDLGLSGPELAVRFRIPESGSIAFTDGVKGPVEKANADLDDFVIARTGGDPTYNLAVVVDDHDMRITHVVRGDDHLDNTSKQINIYRALGWDTPTFGHLPMILGSDGERLSKRHGAVSVMQYREDGFVPAGLLNYLVRLGWSHGDQEVFSLDQMIAAFDLPGVNRAPSRFDTSKAAWINQQHMQQTANAGELAWHMQQAGIDTADGPRLEEAWSLLVERAGSVAELAQQARFLYEPITAYEEKAANKQFKPAAREPLAALQKRLQQLTVFTAEQVQAAIQATVDQLGVGFGKVGQPLRLALTGRAAAPANDQVAALLGRDKTLARIEQALRYIDERAHG